MKCFSFQLNIVANLLKPIYNLNSGTWTHPFLILFYIMRIRGINLFFLYDLLNSMYIIIIFKTLMYEFTFFWFCFSKILISVLIIKGFIFK